MTQPRKVLIIDDEESMLLLLERYVSSVRNVSITKSDSCNDAVVKVGSNHYDLILLDLLMPGIGGIEVLRIIRTSVANAKTPVIIVSVLGDPDTMNVCKSLGIEDYVVKPVVRDRLLFAVSAQLKKRA